MFSEFLVFLVFIHLSYGGIPIVLTTWNFQQACQTAWDSLQKSNSPLDALEAGCRTCQDLQCDFTVGYGGSPDENGESTLDALIFDGNTMNMGAVGNIRRVKDAVGVARRVLENTQHSLLVGDLVTQFATSFGFKDESLQTNYSLGLWNTWKEQNCQPNFWSNVSPDPTRNCGPYKPTKPNPTLTNEIPIQEVRDKHRFNSKNHDTIGMIVIGGEGHVVAGTSTNGANHKIPGRVGDSPIPGAGAYADSKVGAAVGTGDGDVMMRFLPSFLAVEQLRQGASPSKAAKIAISRITEHYPNFMGAVIAADKKGNYAAACNGIEKFPFYVVNARTNLPTINYVKCSKGETNQKTELK